jgi:hypothetical protein
VESLELMLLLLLKKILFGIVGIADFIQIYFYKKIEIMVFLFIGI